ncbi:MAG: helix-turn-helix domain-containing protein [Caulobacteraceae bacterium]|nr:helix-turn-helix domain-containing protein [Caulobacteraceae bacterium]
MDWVWENSQASKTDKLVLLAIARRYRVGVGAWPSQDYLAKQCGVNARSIRSSIARLEALGELVWKSGSGKSGKANTYLLPKLEGAKTSALDAKTSAESAKTSAENDKNFLPLNKQLNKLNKADAFFVFLACFPDRTVSDVLVYRAWVKALLKVASEEVLITAARANKEMLEPNAWLNFEKWRGIDDGDWMLRAR